MKKNEFKELLTSRTYGKAGQLAAAMLKKSPKEEIAIAMEQNTDSSYYTYVSNGSMLAWFLTTGQEIGAAAATAKLCNEFYHKDRKLFDENLVNTCRAIRKAEDGLNVEHESIADAANSIRMHENFTGKGYSMHGRRLSWNYKYFAVVATARIGFSSVNYNPDNHILYLVPGGLGTLFVHYAVLPIVECKRGKGPEEKKEEATTEATEATEATTEEKPETAATAPAKSETSQATQASKERTENIMNENKKESKPEAINTAASKATAPATAPARFLAPALPELPAPKQEKKQAPANLGMLPGVHYKTTKSADHINIWIFGNTKQHKEALKAAGFRWAPNWKGAPDRSGWYKREMIVQ